MNIEEQLVAYFKENADVGMEVSYDTLLVEDGVIDSMGVMDLIAFIEETYGLSMEMDDLEIENFATINHIKTFIVSKSGEA